MTVWCRMGDKPLSEPKMTKIFLVTRRHQAPMNLSGYSNKRIFKWCQTNRYECRYFFFMFIMSVLTVDCFIYNMAFKYSVAQSMCSRFFCGALFCCNRVMNSCDLFIISIYSKMVIFKLCNISLWIGYNYYKTAAELYYITFWRIIPWFLAPVPLLLDRLVFSLVKNADLRKIYFPFIKSWLVKKVSGHHPISLDF